MWSESNWLEVPGEIWFSGLYYGYPLEDDDVVKIIHYAYDNEELMIHTLDHSSYRYMTEEELIEEGFERIDILIEESGDKNDYHYYIFYKYFYIYL